MASKKYISRSDYSLLRRKHLSTEKGIIYENDYMTLNKMDELFAGQIPSFSDSNFRFTLRNTPNIQKKHTRTTWGEAFTLQNTPSAVTNSESVVKIKPDYNSVADFAYFGSAVSLLESSLNKIVRDFPAELYLTEDAQDAINGIPWPIEWGAKPTKFYAVSNDFGIDIWTKHVNDTGITNPLRYFALSEGDYTFFSNESLESPCSWSGWTVQTRNVCFTTKTGEWYAKVVLPFGAGVEMYVLVYDGQYYLYHTNEDYKKYHIRPLQAHIDAYYNGLDDFTSVLLTRDSRPVYTAYFDTPVQDDRGVYMQRRSYSFPTTGGYNPDITSEGYRRYVSSLITVCSFFDDYSSDVIWRAMTHEAMKNLDWTFVKKMGDEIEDLSAIDSARIEAITKIWGRQYDDLKRKTDAIKSTNTISYSEKNNVPDYCLSDTLENDGWDAIALGSEQVASSSQSGNPEIMKIYSGRLYPNESDYFMGYSVTDMNTSFLRRLKLNSRYLHSIKGTRAGVEAMLRLLGFKDDNDTYITSGDLMTYIINEEVRIAKPTTSATGYPDYEEVRRLNILKNNYDAESDEGTLQGLPVKFKSYENESGDMVEYVAPWFDTDKRHDGDTYFQMAGGWGKHDEKPIDLDIAPLIKKLASIPQSGLSIYDETESTLRYVSTISDLRELVDDSISDNTVAYVTDLSSLLTTYKYKNIEESIAFQQSGYSHYFILEHKDVSTVIGWYDGNVFGPDGMYGWRNILTTEYNVSGMSDSNLTSAGWRVLYLESIKEDTKGNNPHVGKMKYDNGQEYMARMARPFKWSVDNNNAEAMSLADIDECEALGFDLISVYDNEKCWYFAAPYEPKSGDTVMVDMSEISDDSDTVAIAPNPNEDDPFYENLYNPEGGENNEEAAADSVLNAKYFNVTFKLDSSLVEYAKPFIMEKVLPYVKAMIPSTTLFSYSITLKTEE